MTRELRSCNEAILIGDSNVNSLRARLKQWHLLLALLVVAVLAVVGVTVAYASLGQQYTSSTSLLVLPSYRAGANQPGAANALSQDNPYRTISPGDAAAAQALVMATNSAEFRRQVELPDGVTYSLTLDTVDGVTARGGFLTLAVEARSQQDLGGSERLVADGIRGTWRDIQIQSGASPASLIDLQNLGTSTTSVASSSPFRASVAIVLLAVVGMLLLFAGYRRLAIQKPPSDSPEEATGPRHPSLDVDGRHSAAALSLDGH